MQQMDAVPPQLLGGFGIGELAVRVHEAPAYEGMELGAIGLGASSGGQQVRVAADARRMLRLQEVIGVMFAALGPTHYAADEVVLEDRAVDVGRLQELVEVNFDWGAVGLDQLLDGLGEVRRQQSVVGSHPLVVTVFVIAFDELDVGGPACISNRNDLVES